MLAVCAPRSTHTKGRLLNDTMVEASGEVADLSAPHATVTDMGSGKIASTDYGHAPTWSGCEQCRGTPTLDALAKLSNALGAVRRHLLLRHELAVLRFDGQLVLYGSSGKGQAGCNY